MKNRAELVWTMAAGAHEQQRMPGERTFAKAGEIEQQVWLERMEDALAAAETAGGVFMPKLLPVEMMEAGATAMFGRASENDCYVVADGHAALVASSPFNAEG